MARSSSRRRGGSRSSSTTTRRSRTRCQAPARTGRASSGSRRRRIRPGTSPTSPRRARSRARSAPSSRSIPPSATPMLTRPLELGPNIVMHSATKYLNGHSDVIAGALATREDDALWQRIRYVRGARRRGARPVRGVAASARDAHAALCASPRRAPTRSRSRERFAGHPKLSHVLYPGCRRIPDTRSRRRQMRGGFGGMLSLRIRAGEEAAKAFTAKLARLQAGDLAGIGREPRRASRQRRRPGHAVSGGSRAAVGRRSSTSTTSSPTSSRRCADAAATRTSERTRR